MVHMVLWLILLQPQQGKDAACAQDGGRWDAVENACLWQPHYRAKAEPDRLELMDVLKPDLFEGYPDMSIVRDRKTGCEWLVAQGGSSAISSPIPGTCHTPPPSACTVVVMHQRKAHKKKGGTRAYTAPVNR